MSSSIVQDGKRFTTLAELLAEAHKHDFEAIESEVILAPTGENKTTVVKKTITIDGKVYTAFGEAGLDNLSDTVKNNPVSMADTRALIRCLRVALNVPETGIEEISPVSTRVTAKQSAAPHSEDKWSTKQADLFRSLPKSKVMTKELQEKYNKLQLEVDRIGFLSNKVAYQIVGALLNCPDK